MTDAFNPIEHARHSAEQALNFHEQVSLGSQNEPSEEPWWQQTRLTTLLHDLAHYADAHDLSFGAALREARAWHRTDLAEQVRYKLGDEVKLRNTPHQGVITAISSDQDALLYEVRIISKPYRRLLKPADLAPASAFPALTIDGTRFLTAATAEQAFHQNVARSLRSPTPKHTRNCRLLADALSTWSGVPRDELYLGARQAISPSPNDLAQQSYPNQPTAACTGPTPAPLYPVPPSIRRTLKGPTL